MLRLVNDAVEAVESEKLEGRIQKMVVSVGEMTGVLPEYLYKYFPEAVKGTILEGAELEVISVPVEVVCHGCGKNYHPTKENKYLCPHCGDGNGRVVAGRDVVLERLELVQ